MFFSPRRFPGQLVHGHDQGQRGRRDRRSRRLCRRGRRDHLLLQHVGDDVPDGFTVNATASAGTGYDAIDADAEVSPGTASWGQPDGDFSLRTTDRLTIEGFGEQFGKTILVDAFRDDREEGDETFSVGVDPVWTVLESLAFGPHVTFETGTGTILGGAAAPIGVGFEQSGYEVSEGEAVDVFVVLDAAADESKTVSLRVGREGGASESDYTLSATEVVFVAGETRKAVSVAAMLDWEDEDDEKIRLSFDSIPAGLTQSTLAEALVEFVDTAAPIPVSFGPGPYTTAEGKSGVEVAVLLAADPGESVTIPLTDAPQGGADTDDYAVPSSVTFSAGETSKTVTVRAKEDEDEEDGEWVLLGFGDLPDGVAAGDPATVVVNLTDETGPLPPEQVRRVPVSFGAGPYTATRGGRRPRWRWCWPPTRKSR